MAMPPKKAASPIIAGERAFTGMPACHKEQGGCSSSVWLLQSTKIPKPYLPGFKFSSQLPVGRKLSKNFCQFYAVNFLFLTYFS
jgi:hypothetical protein